MGSTLKTAFLLGLLTLVFLYAGSALGGQAGMTIALVIAVVMNMGSYWFSDRIVLRMYRAREVTREQAPELIEMVESVAHRAAVPMPKVYIIPGEAPNAFATGRDPGHAAVAMTQGIVRMLERDELEGVLAHEMGHIVNRDILIGSVAATLAGAIGYMAHIAGFGLLFGGFGGDRRGGGLGALAMLILAPLMAMIIQMAVSRGREFKADATAARLTHKPLALARALAKISHGVERIPMEATPATAHMLIMNPLRGGLSGLFSTHPPTTERIARLEEIARGISP